MKPDHEAAKKWAKRMRWTPEALTEEEINFARAYLDLVAREQRAVELLERAYWLVEHFETATYDTKSDWGRLVRAFLAERREV